MAQLPIQYPGPRFNVGHGVVAVLEKKPTQNLLIRPQRSILLNFFIEIDKR